MAGICLNEHQDKEEINAKLFLRGERGRERGREEGEKRGAQRKRTRTNHSFMTEMKPTSSTGPKCLWSYRKCI